MLATCSGDQTCFHQPEVRSSLLWSHPCVLQSYSIDNMIDLWVAATGRLKVTANLHLKVSYFKIPSTHCTNEHSILFSSSQQRLRSPWTSLGAAACGELGTDSMQQEKVCKKKSERGKKAFVHRMFRQLYITSFHSHAHRRVPLARHAHALHAQRLTWVTWLLGWVGNSHVHSSHVRWFSYMHKDFTAWTCCWRDDHMYTRLRNIIIITCR